MSKIIKQMEMESLRNLFKDVKDLVVLKIQKLDAPIETNLRSTLRKKDIRLKTVRNSLTRKVFGELGIDVGDGVWEGPTTFAFGTNSIAELSRAINEEIFKGAKTAPLYKDKVTTKGMGAVLEGEPISFEDALEMPTREEAISQVLGMILGPWSSLAGCLAGPGGQVASQIEKISEGGEGGEGGEGS